MRTTVDMEPGVRLVGGMLEIVEGEKLIQLHLPQRVIEAIARGEREGKECEYGFAFSLSTPPEKGDNWCLFTRVAGLKVVLSVPENLPQLFADALAGVAE